MVAHVVGVGVIAEGFEQREIVLADEVIRGGVDIGRTFGQGHPRPNPAVDQGEAWKLVLGAQDLFDALHGLEDDRAGVQVVGQHIIELGQGLIGLIDLEEQIGLADAHCGFEIGTRGKEQRDAIEGGDLGEIGPGGDGAGERLAGEVGIGSNEEVVNGLAEGVGLCGAELILCGEIGQGDPGGAISGRELDFAHVEVEPARRRKQIGQREKESGGLAGGAVDALECGEEGNVGIGQRLLGLGIGYLGRPVEIFGVSALIEIPNRLPIDLVEQPDPGVCDTAGPPAAAVADAGGNSEGLGDTRGEVGLLDADAAELEDVLQSVGVSGDFLISAGVERGVVIVDVEIDRADRIVIGVSAGGPEDFIIGDLQIDDVGFELPTERSLVETDGDAGMGEVGEQLCGSLRIELGRSVVALPGGRFVPDDGQGGGEVGIVVKVGGLGVAKLAEDFDDSLGRVAVADGGHEGRHQVWLGGQPGEGLLLIGGDLAQGTEIAGELAASGKGDDSGLVRRRRIGQSGGGLALQIGRKGGKAIGIDGGDGLLN